jgi:fumarate reductase subunit C
MSAYRRAMPLTWWLRNRAYFLFMVRELTSIPIAVYLILLLLMLRKLAAGREAYEAYLRFLATPGMLAFHLLALAAALFHAITWINITPKVLVVRVGENRVPPALVASVNYAAWIVLSILIAWIVMRG